MISRLSALAVLVVFLAACSKTSEYTHVIPADATAVVSLNLQTLADKSGLNDKENEAMKQKITESIKSGASAIAFQQLEKIMKDPSESGLDFKAPLYYFTSISFPYNVLIGKVSSADKAKTSVEAMVKEQLCQPIEEADGYSFTVARGTNLIAFNETVVLLISTNGTSQLEEAKNSIATLFKQTAENSIAKNEGFQKMLKQKGDITFFASMADMPDTYTRQLNIKLPASVTPKELMLLGGIGFEKGKIATQVEFFTENKEVEALLKKQNEALKKLNTSFLKNFPASTLAFFNIGVNGEALYNNLLENEEFRNNVSIAKAAEVKNLFSTFNGDISIGLLNVDMMKQAPTFVAYADVTNGDALKALYTNKKSIGLGRGEDILQLNENEYVFKSKGINVFFGVKEKQMYATNDEMLYKSIGKAVDKSIKDTAYASDMKGQMIFFVINMEAILELPVVKMVMGFGGEEYKMYANLASKVSYFEVCSNSEAGQINLLLKDKEVNALKQIVDFAKQFAGM